MCVCVCVCVCVCNRERETDRRLQHFIGAVRLEVALRRMTLKYRESDKSADGSYAFELLSRYFDVTH